MSDTSSTPPLSDRSGVNDAVRVQILAAEHWSLLATRSMTWNELFSRTGMFLTVLSAAVVALALMAQATDFGENFRVFALLVLPVVLILGIGTHIRLGDALTEDARLVLAMNRLRHAYLELAPELEPYFTTSHHDDIAGMIQTFMVPTFSLTPARLLAGSPLIVALIDAAVAGVLGAIVADALGGGTAVYVTVGVVIALGVATLLVGVIPARQVAQMRRDYRPHFPS